MPLMFRLRITQHICTLSALLMTLFFIVLYMFSPRVFITAQSLLIIGWTGELFGEKLYDVGEIGVLISV